MARLEMRKFSQAQHSVCTFVATPDFGETLEEVMQPAYWSNMAPIIKAALAKPNAHVDIEIRPVGNPYYARLVVLHAENAQVETKLLQYVELTGEQKLPKQAPMIKELDLGKFKAERNGGWVRIIRNDDGQVMKGGFRTLKAAQDWASENLQVEVSL